MHEQNWLRERQKLLNLWNINRRTQKPQEQNDSKENTKTRGEHFVLSYCKIST